MSDRHYRKNQADALEAIERKRQVMDVRHAELADTAGISHATWRRIRREGRAFPAQITALRFALRTIEARRKGAEAVFPADEVAP